MALPRNGRLYPLTSLQIGDIQSYVSRLFLLVAYEGLKLVFLVDNGPWTFNTRPSRPAELWQLMVNKSRGSPFANRLRDYTGQEKEDGWLSLLVALQRSCKQRAEVKKPSHGMYGCVAFEVAWSDVRGINYSNELQTDTCVSLEVRVVTKREFDSLEQAQACYATILSGCNDLGASLSVPKIPSGKSVGMNFSRKGAGKNMQGLVSDRAQSTKVHADDSVRGLRSARAVEKKHARKRQLDDTTRPYVSYGSSATLISELSRAYIISLASKFGARLGTINPGSLPPEYFTPPSSPYSGQVLHFKNYISSKPKDAKKLRIMPVNEDVESEAVPESRILKVKESLPRTSLSSVGGDKAKALYEGNQSGVSYGGFDQTRLLGCWRCRPKREGTVSKDSAQDCVRCSARVEERLDKVYVHPDRLIAPAETYRDILILFRFSEPLLPLELRQIITADRRLLKMLESGLPSWVIFLQSYPILCHLYRPWMRPLCGTIYYLVSIVTVLIGFYDLYKNVPVLKATAAHICGPLFDWIEEWGMVSRLKYLGTMLFLQNCEKAFEWAVAVTRASRQVSMVVMRPILQPLILCGETFLPLWVGISYAVQTLAQFILTTLSSILLSISSMLRILVWPFIALLTAFWNLGKALLYPVFSTIWSVLILPVQLMRLVASLVVVLSSEVFDGLQIMWFALNDSVQLLATGSSAVNSLQIVKSSTPTPSMWRTLWNDILSKVFHAVNGIVKGLAAFVAACNRHRLSIYNQFVDLLFRASRMLKSGQYVAVSACRQMFPPPDQIEGGPKAAIEEVEPEAEETPEPTQFSSGLPLNLRLRTKGNSTLTPLSLQEQISTLQDGGL